MRTIAPYGFVVIVRGPDGEPTGEAWWCETGEDAQAVLAEHRSTWYMQTYRRVADEES